MKGLCSVNSVSMFYFLIRLVMLKLKGNYSSVIMIVYGRIRKF